MIKTILWDIDGTLLDFKVAEHMAIKSLFAEFGLGECTDEMIGRYSLINDSYWKRLERNEITKDEVLTGRFVEFFGEIGVDRSIAEDFNKKYQLRLGDTIVYRDESYKLVKSLKERVMQYAVSNGTVVAQEKKLRRSGFDKLLDGIFLSEELGVEKPNVLFFEKVFEKIKPADLNEVIIVGDSLTSDILGGINAKIKTCWYNPGSKKADPKLNIDYEIKNLNEILGILD
ncbi:MAG: YjjG family noncanonical pyrimidine nucleotidase [Eubacterium sp.]|nr:YjjG family noncanonical pyrimidine nucleotidase [Eubacterium sp.]